MILKNTPLLLAKDFELYYVKITFLGVELTYFHDSNQTNI